MSCLLRIVLHNAKLLLNIAMPKLSVVNTVMNVWVPKNVGVIA